VAFWNGMLCTKRCAKNYNKLKNMKIGDEVVYIQRTLDDIGLINGKTYPVLGVSRCNCADSLCIDVGISQPKGHYATQCPTCKVIINTGEAWYFHHSGFRLLSLIRTEKEYSNYVLL
jgi:hypothetical protein